MPTIMLRSAAAVAAAVFAPSSMLGPLADRVGRLVIRSRLGRVVQPESERRRTRSTAPVVAFLSLAVFAGSVTGQQVSGAPAIMVQYGDLVDVSRHGHSGEPASDILERLKLSTPEGIAEAAAAREELEKAERVAEDDDLITDEVATYVKENAALLKLRALLRPINARELIADVEPVCEPVAFVLNDALAQMDPATLNTDLIELAAFHPAGRVEPAWVDLVRSRRFVIYTDGRSYCRAFLPGPSAKAAWTAAYPAMRHALLSLLNAAAGGAAAPKLKVEIYAYENDIPRTTFSLHPTKLALDLAATDLGTPAGRTPLNLAGLREFFAQGLVLEGCGVDASGELVLIGSRTDKPPTLEGHPIELSDLAVAYRASSYAGHGESYMSLDPSHDDDLVNVNFGGRLYDTRLGWVAYRCDLRFKTLGDDVDAVTFDNVRQKILALLPDYSSQQSRRFATPGFLSVVSEGTRFWFYPDDFKVVAAADGKSCLVTRPRFTAAAERQEGRDAKGDPIDSTTPGWTSETLAHFNKNYDTFANVFPEVAELDHAARLLAVAEWLHQANQTGRIALDLDQLLAEPLPVNPTPRQRDQLKLAYAVKKEGIPAEHKLYCLATPRGLAEFERDMPTFQKADSGWTLMSVVGGGLDFSARKAVANAAKASVEEDAILKKSLQRTDGFAVGGKHYKPVRGSGGNGPPEPPHKSSVAASAPEPGPLGPGSMGRRYGPADSPVVEGLVVKNGSGPGVRAQKIGSDSYFSEATAHSVWTGEHGKPERFAANTTEGVVNYQLRHRNGVMAVKRLMKRPLAAADADILSAALIERDLAPSQAWNLVPLDSDVRALDLTPGKEALICFREDGHYVVRAYRANAEPVVLRGDEAINRLHEASREKVRAFSVPGKAELLHVSSQGDQIVLQIGKRPPINLDRGTWGKWLVEPDAAPPQPLADVVNEFANQGTELVVMRDALQAVPRRLANREPKWLDDFKNAMDAEKQARLKLLRMTPDELEVQIDELGKLAETQSDSYKDLIHKEMAKLERLKSLAAEERTERIKKIEASRLAFQIDRMVDRASDDAVFLMGTLKSKLPKVRVSYDDPSKAVPDRISKEPMVKSRLDVGLAVPPAEAGVDDKGILRRIVDAFEDGGIPLVKTPADLERVGNVIVITAHNDQALFDYIQTLGEHRIGGKSALDGKFLMMMTCFEEGNPNMVSELLRRYNCAGVHVQAERVHKDAVQCTLTELANRLGKIESGAPPRRLRDLYDDTLKELLDSSDPQLKFLKAEFEKLQRGRVQWCLLDRPKPGPAARAVLG